MPDQWDMWDTAKRNNSKCYLHLQSGKHTMASLPKILWLWYLKTKKWKPISTFQEECDAMDVVITYFGYGFVINKPGKLFIP